MRIARLLLAALAVLPLAACNEHELVGLWKSDLPPDVLEYIEFKGNGDVVLKSAKKELNGRWSTIEGKRVKIEVVGRLSSLAEMCKYDLAEKQLSLDGCTLSGTLLRIDA